MYEAAKRAMDGMPKMYSHSLTDASGKVVPVAKHEIVLVLSDVADTQWTPGSAGNFFTSAHIADPSTAAVRPAWRVQLGGGPLGAWRARGAGSEHAPPFRSGVVKRLE